MDTTGYLSIGSNWGDRLYNLRRCFELLQFETIRVDRISSIYETEPVGVGDQPLFFNLACRIEYARSAFDLLEDCRKVERLMGRRGKGQSTARVIDVDILFFGELILCAPQLQVPHPRLYQRNFVLIPMEEIASDWVDPATGKTIAQLRRESGDTGRVKRLSLRL